MNSITVVNKGGLDNLIVKVSERKLVGDNEVLVGWKASSLNYHDLLIAQGHIPVKEGRVLMSDGAGEILEIGSKVSMWSVGDKVMSMFFPHWIEGMPKYKDIQYISGETVDGYLIQKSVVSEESITLMPTEYSFAEAATLPCAAVTAYNGLMKAKNFKSGNKVLIEGTGGMSIFAMQLALANDCEVYATSSSDEKAKRLLELGCKEVVNYKTDPIWGKTIYKMSEGGVDNVLDVGGGSTMKQSIEALKLGGEIAAIGILSGGRKGELTFPKLFFKFATIRGLAVGNRQMQNELVELINESNLKPIIDRSFGFNQIKEAFEYQLSGKHFGKIVLEW